MCRALARGVSRYFEADLRAMPLFISARIRFDIWPHLLPFWKVVHMPTLLRSGPALVRFQPTFAAVLMHVAVCIQLGQYDVGVRQFSQALGPLYSDSRREMGHFPKLRTSNIRKEFFFFESG